jgi:hypothetical protein
MARSMGGIRTVERWSYRYNTSYRLVFASLSLCVIRDLSPYGIIGFPKGSFSNWKHIGISIFS